MCKLSRAFEGCAGKYGKKRANLPYNRSNSYLSVVSGATRRDYYGHIGQTGNLLLMAPAAMGGISQPTTTLCARCYAERRCWLWLEPPDRYGE